MPRKYVVNPGDLFRKTGNPPSRWIVDQAVDCQGMPPHVRLVEQGGNHRTVTIALSALLDPEVYQPGAV